MKWTTCTPVSFKGDDGFWARDSGLICKGVQNSGIECTSVMPEPWHEGDNQRDLIRVPYDNLENATWWKATKFEAVVLYSWGHPKYWKVAKAIKEAGLKLYINIDSGALINCRLNFKKILKLQLQMQRQITSWKKWTARYDASKTSDSQLGEFTMNPDAYKQGFIGVMLIYSKCIAKFLLDGFCIERFRSKHLAYADYIGVVNKGALDAWQEWSRHYAPKLCERFVLINHPVNISTSSKIAEIAHKRTNAIVAVGRWHDYLAKRTQLLAQTIELFLKLRPDYQFWIYGKYPEVFANWHNSLPDNIKKNVILHGFVSNDVVLNQFRKAKISLCTSISEGSHIASEEALCNGLSIVGPDLDSLACLRDYVSQGHGTLAMQDNSPGLAQALLTEAAAWDQGLRDPQQISQYWVNELSVGSIVNKIRNLLTDSKK